MSELLDLAKAIVDRARPGEGVEVYVARGHDTEVRAYDGLIEQLATASSAGVGIRVVIPAGAGDGAGDGVGHRAEEVEGNRVGFAWAGSLEPSVIDEVLREARDNAAYATPDPDVVLAEPDGVLAPDVDLWHPDFASTGTDRKVEMALELERMVRGADPRVRQVDAADYGDASVEMALASTTGICAATRRTSAFLSVSAIASDGRSTQTGSGFSVGKAATDLDPERAGTDAVARAVRLLGAGKPRSARVTAVFDPRVVSTILSVVSGALSGEAVVKGRSIFAGRVGEEVASERVTVVDDPTDGRAFGAARYDGEGLACRRNVLIDAGVLQGFVYDTVSARRAGTVSTGSAVRGGFAGTPGAGCRAVVLAPGRLDQEAILREVQTGIYVQSVTGVHSGVNAVSGDFSVGAEGLMIRTGALAEPVREATVASSLQRMLLSILHIGSDIEWLPGMAAGQTLAVGDMQLSGE